MASKEDVAKFLRKLKIKMEIFGVLFLDDRGKNHYPAAAHLHLWYFPQYDTLRTSILHPYGVY